MNKYQIYEKSKKNKKIAKECTKIELILMIIMIIIDFILLYRYNEKYNIENILSIQIIVSMVIIFITNIIVKVFDKIYFRKYAMGRHQNTIFKNHIKNEIIVGEREKEGCIIHKYMYSLKIPKYKCILNRYYVKELKSGWFWIPSSQRNHYTFKFITKDNVLEYIFELPKDSWCSLYDIRERINNAELIDNKIIIRTSLSQNQQITLLDEMDFIDNIEKMYLELFSFLDEGKLYDKK